MAPRQEFSVDLKAGDASVAAVDLAGVAYLDLMNAPMITANDKQRVVSFAPMRRSVTVRSTTSMGAEVLLKCGATVLRLQQYGSLIVSFDGTADGMSVVQTRDDVSALMDLLDVDAGSIDDGDALVYDKPSGTFKGAAVSGGSTPAPAGRPVPVSRTFTASNGATINHAFAYDPEVWAKNGAGEPCSVDYTYSSGAVDVVFHQPFTGTVYLG